MLGSAVSSSTPNDFHPKAHIGPPTDPVMNRYTCEGPPRKGCTPVGMQRALDSAIGLPRRSTNALLMLGFVMPLDVRRILMCAFPWSDRRPDRGRPTSGGRLLVRPRRRTIARAR